MALLVALLLLLLRLITGDVFGVVLKPCANEARKRNVIFTLRKFYSQLAPQVLDVWRTCVLGCDQHFNTFFRVTVLEAGRNILTLPNLGQMLTCLHA